MKGLRPSSRAGKSRPDLCTRNQEFLTLGSSAVHSVAGSWAPQPERGSSGTWLGCPVGPAHPLVGGRLTQDVYHLSQSWTAEEPLGSSVLGSWKPSILPLPGNAGLLLTRKSPSRRDVSPAYLPFLQPVSFAAFPSAALKTLFEARSKI